MDGYVGYAVDFEIVDSEAEEVEQCVIDTNGDYAECVDRMVETMTEYDKWGNIKR